MSAAQAARDDLYAQMSDTEGWGLSSSITLSMSNGSTDIQLSQHYKNRMLLDIVSQQSVSWSIKQNPC